MTRTRIVGACLVAVFALAALLAGNAFAAGTPTWYECAKASPKNTGGYSNKTCTEVDGAGTGAYNLQPGVGKGKEFKGKGGAAVLHIKTWLGDDKVECASSKDSGKIALPDLEEHVTVIYSKCVALGTKNCSSAGAKKGEVKITGLKGELGYLNETGPEIGLKLESEAHPGPEGELVSFSCEDLEASVTGGIIGVIKGDVNTIAKVTETVDVPGEYIGEHTYDGYKYKPLVNLVGWSDEAAAIAAEIEADEKGEIAKIERPILKTLICGEYIEELLGEKCTPEAYAGLSSTTVNKGEEVMIKA